jgi:hypothetical protein
MHLLQDTIAKIKKIEQKQDIGLVIYQDMQVN